MKSCRKCLLAIAAVCAAATGQAQELRDTLTAARVSADRLKTVMRTQTGLTRLEGKDLNSGFAVFSTPDLIKSLQLLPGVASGTELTPEQEALMEETAPEATICSSWTARPYTTPAI